MSGKLTKADYPPHWNVLRAMVRLRADDACECRGECGSDHAVWGIPEHRCDIPNHARIVRDPLDPAIWWKEQDAPTHHLWLSEFKVVKCVLTIAHLCQDSTCGDMTHLRAMCQRCHLKLDAQQHVRNAAQTRRQAQVAAGQLVLL